MCNKGSENWRCFCAWAHDGSYCAVRASWTDVGGRSPFLGGGYVTVHYRSRQYYKSKVLHNTEEPDFQRSTVPSLAHRLKKRIKKFRCQAHNASFGTLFGAIRGQLLTSGSVFKVPLEIPFWSKID